jgi:DNA-binding IclR family transcriptional regulator
MDEREPTRPRYAAPALERALDIIELLAATSDGLTLSDIARALDRKPGEVFRVLEVLKRRGYVGAERTSDRLVLSLKLFELAHRQPRLRRLVLEALPIMERLAKSCGQSCHLAVRGGGEMLVVAQVDGPSHMGFAVQVGARVGMLTSSSGRVYLAFQPPERRAEILARLDPGDIDAWEEPRLASIRAAGFEAVPSDFIEGIVNMSCPVLDTSGEAAGSLTVPYLRWRTGLSVTSAEEACARLAEAARELSRRIGGAAAVETRDRPHAGTAAWSGGRSSS